MDKIVDNLNTGEENYKTSENLINPDEKRTLDDNDLDLNFDEEENGDIKIGGDQLPTIFEKSQMEEGHDLKHLKYRTHLKKQSEVPLGT